MMVPTVLIEFLTAFISERFLQAVWFATHVTFRRASGLITCF